MPFNWRSASGEIKALRGHDTKHFIHPDDPTKRICIQSSGLLHAFTDKGFEDIDTELPDFNFPEGIEFKVKADKHPCLDLPAWGDARVEENGKVVRVYDKKGVSIFRYRDPVVCEKGKPAFKVVHKNTGAKIRDAFGPKEQIDPSMEKIVHSENAGAATFAVEGGKLHMVPPANLHGNYTLQGFDATDTGSTNSKDTYCDSNAPNSNYGTGDYLDVSLFLDTDGETILWQNVAFLGFSLSSGSGTISKIELYCYLYTGNASIVYASNIYGSDVFGESTATWNNYDGSNAWTIGAGYFPAAWTKTTASGWDYFDISSYSGITWGSTIQLKIGCGSVADEQKSRFYYSRSYSESSYRPYIKITYTPANITLTVQDAAIGVSAENVALVQQKTLAVQDAVIATAAANVVLAPDFLLVVQDALVATAADNADLVQQNVLAVQDALIAVAAESPALVQQNTLAVQDAVVGVVADNLTLVQNYMISAVADALISVVAGNAVLSKGYRADDYILTDFFCFQDFNEIKNNYAGAAPPSIPVTGVLWTDTANLLLKIYRPDGTWQTIGVYQEGLAPVGSIVPWIGGYFGDGSNGTYTRVLGTANTVAAANAYANPWGWFVCDGSALNDAASPVWIGANRYLPNLTDSRFIQGYTAVGGTGGENANSHTHTATPPTTTSGASTPAGAQAATTTPTFAIAPHPHTHSFSFTSVTSAAASNTENRPAYLACFYLVRVK